MMLVAASTKGRKLRPDGSHIHIGAADVIRYRLSAKQWPIFSNTRHKGLLFIGCPLLFYAAGNAIHAQHILGSARICKLLPGDLLNEAAIHDLPAVHTVLQLRECRFGVGPSVKGLRKDLSFIRLKGHYWYTSLQGGCVPLSANDWRLLSEIKGSAV